VGFADCTLIFASESGENITRVQGKAKLPLASLKLRITSWVDASSAALMAVASALVSGTKYVSVNLVGTTVVMREPGSPD